MQARPSSAARWCWRLWPPGSARGGGGRSRSCCWRRSWASSSAIRIASSAADALGGPVAGRRPRDGRRARASRRRARRATGSRSASSCRRWTSTSTASPYGGTLTRVTYQPGRFLPAYRAESGAAERAHRALGRARGPHRRVPPGRRRAGPARRLPRPRRRDGDDRRALRADEVRLAHGRLRRPRRAAAGPGRRPRPRRRDAARRVPAAIGRRRTDRRAEGAPLRADGARRPRAAFAAASTCCRACSRSATCSAATPASSTRCAATSSTAALFIGFAIVLDMLDGRIARMTGTSSAFGVEFDSLADVVSFGIAPAVLCFAWGLKGFDRLGWAAGVRVRVGGGDPAGALQHPDQRPGRGQALLRRHAEPGGRRRAGGDGLRVSRTVVAGWPYNLLALPMVLVPAFLMVSTIRYRSFKTFDLGARRSYRDLLLMALVIAAIATHPQITLVVLAYGYLASGFDRLGVAGWLSPRADAPAPAERPTPPRSDARREPLRGRVGPDAGRRRRVTLELTAPALGRAGVRLAAAPSSAAARSSPSCRRRASTADGDACRRAARRCAARCSGPGRCPLALVEK